MPVFTNTCIFCSRDSSGDEGSDVFHQKTKIESLQQFVKLSQRYLETGFQLKTVNGNEGEEVLESCQDCLLLVESFSNLYHEWKCLEMKVEWKLRQLSDVVNSSGGKFWNADCSNEDKERVEVLKKFRTEFQQKCNRKFSKSFPRVSLNRFQELSTKREAFPLNTHVILDYNQLFLGWVSTLAAVFLLGIGNWLQIPNATSQQTEQQYQILISKCDDDDDDEQHLNLEHIPSYDIASDNHLESRTIQKESELERSKLGKPFASKLQSNSVFKVKNRKRRGLQKCFAKKQRDDLPTNAQFRCSCCGRNFSSFLLLQRHRKAFTHILMKRKLLGKVGNRKCSTRSKRQSKTSNKIASCNDGKNENVGVLRPLRRIEKQRVEKDDFDGSSEDDEQASLGSADDEWNMNSSNGGSSCSSSSSGSISSDEEMDTELPLTATPSPGVPTETYACTKDSCVQSFHFKEELEEHLQLHGSFPCSLCDIVKEYAPNLALHENDHMKQTKTEAQAEESEKKRRKSGKVMRYCARCDYSTDQRFLYINHYLTTHLKVPAQRIMCRICKAWAADRKSFVQHMKKHPKVKQEKEYFCDAVSCKVGFITQPELDAHKRLHGNFSCKFCPSVENHVATLAIHELTHRQSASTSENLKYSCSRCTVHTKSKQAYVSHFAWAHLKLRSGLDLCSICKTPLRSNASKNLHFFRHHDTRGVDPKSVKKCRQCPAYFLKRKQLQFHKNEIHPFSGQNLENSDTSSESSDEEDRQKTGAHHPTKCADCGTFFVRLSTLQKHKENCKRKVSKTKTAKKQFACEVGSCKHRFDFKEELEIHQKHHGKFSCQFCKVVKTYAPKLAIHEIVHGNVKCANRKIQWVCVRCNKTTKDKQGYVNHYLKQHFGLPLQRVMCPICKILYTKESLKHHRQNFHNVEGADPKSVHKCDECDAYFLKTSQLDEHVKKLHGPSCSDPKFGKPEYHRKYNCDVGKDCQKSFETEEDLENHRKLHGTFTCSFCPAVESYAPKLADHETTHVEAPFSEKSPGRRGKTYNCSRCPSVFYGRFQYVTHFLETHLNLPSESLTCQNCGEKYAGYKKLTKHTKVQHDVSGMREEDIARCNQCPAFFMTHIQLAAHRKKKHGEDLSTCVDCGRKYANPCVLRTHRSVVHKKKEVDFPIGCDVPNCERRFERVSELAWHKQNTHEGKGEDKSLICHECGKKVATKTALAVHMQLHGAVFSTKKKADPKRYVCEECGKYFRGQSLLDIHRLSHTGPSSWKYCCLFCDKKSATERLLMEHMRTHTNEKPFICEYCGEEYAHGHNLRNHKNKKHNANDRPGERKIVNGQASKKGQKLPPRLKK